MSLENHFGSSFLVSVVYNIIVKEKAAKGVIFNVIFTLFIFVLLLQDRNNDSGERRNFNGGGGDRGERRNFNGGGGDRGGNRDYNGGGGDHGGKRNYNGGGDRGGNRDYNGGERRNYNGGGGDRGDRGDKRNFNGDGGDRGDKRDGGDRGERRNYNGGGGDRGDKRNYNDNRDGERGDGGGRRFDKDRNNRDGETDGDGEPQKPREFYIPPEPTSDEDEMFKSGISSGINFDKFDKIPIKVSGNNAPEQITNFKEAGLRDLVLSNVLKSGYSKPTPIQKTAIPIILAGRDLMACAQTGSGKTAAFLLPIINQLLTDSVDMSVGKPQALIVSPTRELSIQIYNEARKFAMGSYLKVSIVYGGTSSKHQSEKISKGCHILICTPGRLLDFVDRDFIRFEDTRFVVLDEADRMLDMGFLEPMRRILSHETIKQKSDGRQTLMFSATFPEDIQRLASEFLNDYIFVTVGIVGGACSDVLQTIYEVSKNTKRTKLMEILNESSDGVLVFVETKRSADFLASMFSESGFPTTSIHGDRLQSQREKALADFKSGHMKVLIATSVAARGLDIKNIAHVVNYDMPSTIDDYVHRIGRTGRVGNSGRATTFFCPETDSAVASDLMRVLKDAGQDVPEFLNSMSGGGGGMFRSNNRFGGRDVRQNNNNNDQASGPPALEEEEEWN